MLANKALRKNSAFHIDGESLSTESWAHATRGRLLPHFSRQGMAPGRSMVPRVDSELPRLRKLAEEIIAMIEAEYR